MRRAFLGGIVLICGLFVFLARSDAAPERVRLELQAAPRGVPRGGQIPLNALVQIDGGWHINAHKPNRPYLIPTELTFVLPPGVSTAAVFYPTPEKKVMAFARGQELLLYEGKLGFGTTLEVPADFGSDQVRVEAALRYQACNDTTCLPPATTRADLIVPVVSVSQGVQPGDGGSSGSAVQGTQEGARFERWLQERGLLFTLCAVALLGLGLNLTPCVYPLISITVAYFGGQTRRRSRVALLATLYVLGIAASFSALGVAAALSGGILGAALQQPPVILAIAALLVVLALGSFGVYQFQPPAVLTRWAGGASTGALGALFMGLTMGIVAAPCVGPIVLGLLVFVGSQQDPQLGFLLFFALALGMGAPYLVLAIAAGSLKGLPRSGEWLLWTERLFGCVLLSLAVYFVAPLLGEPLRSYLLPFMVAASGVYLGFIEPAGHAVPYFPTFKRLAGVALLGAALWLGRPVGGAGAVAWMPIAVLPSDGADQPVLIDFAADWCIPCREMEYTTYVDPDVLQEARRFQMVKADITQENETTGALIERYEVRGVPTVILFSSRGEESHRMVGYVGPDELLAAMRDTL